MPSGGGGAVLVVAVWREVNILRTISCASLGPRPLSFKTSIIKAEPKAVIKFVAMFKISFEAIFLTHKNELSENFKIPQQ